MLKHSHNKKCSLETCTWLLLMLLQDLFASVWPHRVHKKPFLLKITVLYLYYSRLNYTIVQKKTTNIEKLFYLWLILFVWFKVFLNRHLLYILCIYCKNGTKVISCQEETVRLLVKLHYKKIPELASLRFLKLNLEFQNTKM